MILKTKGLCNREGKKGKFWTVQPGFCCVCGAGASGFSLVSLIGFRAQGCIAEAYHDSNNSSSTFFEGGFHARLPANESDRQVWPNFLGLRLPEAYNDLGTCHIGQQVF